MSMPDGKTAMVLLDRIISQTRYIVVIAVAASLALTATLSLFGAVHGARGGQHC